MCIILINYDKHPEYRLILAANRDEFYSRAASKASFWEESPDIFSGRDLQGNGTWLGATKTGRIACITNYREPHAVREGLPSRGGLVSRFLSEKIQADEYLEILKKTGIQYAGFNLIFGTVDKLLYYSNRGNLLPEITPGIHGLSNHLLDTPWPKIRIGKDALRSLNNLSINELTESLFKILADRTQYDDNLLPDTGVGIEWERMLSPVFISTPVYGTRASTVVVVDRNNELTFIEKTFNGNPGDPDKVRISFRINE